MKVDYKKEPFIHLILLLDPSTSLRFAQDDEVEGRFAQDDGFVERRCSQNDELFVIPGQAESLNPGSKTTLGLDSGFKLSACPGMTMPFNRDYNSFFNNMAGR